MHKKNTLSKEEIIHLSKLANLKLTDKEIEKFQKQLTETLDYVENLSELDTKDIVETHHTVNLENISFADGEENKRGLTADEALANSKSKKGSYFVVKRIM